MAIKKLYNKTKEISIISLIIIRIVRFIEVTAHFLIKPKFVVNDCKVVLELDYKNSTIKRIYPNPSEEVALVENINSYLSNYWNDGYYCKENAIKESSRYFTIDGEEVE